MMYESLRARARRAKQTIDAPSVEGFVSGVLACVREAAERGEPDGRGLVRVDVPARLLRIGKRLHVPFCMDD